MAYADEMARIQKRRLMTQALIQQGARPQGVQAGRIFVGPSNLSSLASLASVIAGGVMDRKLEKQETTLKDQRRKQLSDVLRGVTQPGNMTGMPITGTGAMVPPSGGPATGNPFGTPPQTPAQSAPNLPQSPTSQMQVPPSPPFNPAAAPQNDAALQFLQDLPIEQQEAFVSQLIAAGMKPPEEFSLKPGEVRYRGGKKIAEAPAAPEKLPTAILEYQQALKDGFKGSFLDYQLKLRQAGATRVSVGDNKPPAGYRWKADGSLEPIPGGAAARDADKYQREVEESQQKSVAKFTQTVSSIDSTMGEIDKAMKQAGGLETGFTGAMLAKIPGSDSYNLAKTLETIKANIGFDKLQAMRDASPTGGALGQVAIQELTALQNSIASLDQAQDEKQLIANLQKVKQHYQNWKGVVARSQRERTEQQPAQSSGAQPPQIDVKTRAQSYY